MVRTLVLSAGLVAAAHPSPASALPVSTAPPAERSPPAAAPRAGERVAPQIRDGAADDRPRERVTHRRVQPCVPHSDCLSLRRELLRQLMDDMRRAEARRIVYSLPEFHELRELLKSVGEAAEAADRTQSPTRAFRPVARLITDPVR